MRQAGGEWKSGFSAVVCAGVVAACALFLPSCAAKHQPLEDFTSGQKSKIAEGSAYIQADFDFWAAVYEPTIDDLEAFRQAWVEHGEAFPESKPIGEIEKQLRTSGQKVVVAALFMTAYENADLKDKSQGWTVYPVPKKITELSESDVVLRRLMPVKNRWARYFLMTFSPDVLLQANQIVIGNATSRIELKRR